MREPVLFALAVDEAASFFRDLSDDPWLAVELPLPAELDAEALRAVRAIVYAVIQAVDFTLEESTALIGRLVEIDRRLAAADRDPLDLRLERCRYFSAEGSRPRGAAMLTAFPPSYPRILGIARINILCRPPASNRAAGKVTAGKASVRKIRVCRPPRPRRLIR